MGEKRLLIFLLVFLFGFSNATPTFPVGEKTVKNDWFQCFETTSAGEMIVKECMTGAVGCFVDVLEQKDGRYEVSEARGCAFVDKPFSEDNQQFVCKTPRCNSLENYPANETFMPCYVLDNAGKPGIELCKTKSCFVKTSLLNYVENRGCWNDSDVNGDDVVVCDTPKCNSAEKYPVVDPKGHLCYKYDGRHEALVNCPNQNCVVNYARGVGAVPAPDAVWRSDRDCAYDQAFDDSHWICSTPGCNSVKNYPLYGKFVPCYESDANGDITLKDCSKEAVGCYIQVSEDEDGNYVYTGKRGCAMVDESFSKKNMRYICYQAFCNSEKNYPVNKIAFSCYASDGKEDVYLKPCLQERYHKIDSCDVEYKLDPTNNVTVYTRKRDCGSENFPHAGFEQTYRCDSSNCNSLENFAPNQEVFQCFGNGESSTEICSIRQCYVKTKNVIEGGVTFTNDRGCTDKLNGNLENVLTCDTALCNSYDNYPVVDLEKDTYICHKTIGNQTALVKCPNNYCEVGLRKVEGGTLMYTKHRDCALNDKPFDEEYMTMTCSTPRCNSLKELPVAKTFFACYENDADGNFTVTTCSDDDVGCFVKISENNGEYIYTEERGCANKTLADQNMISVCNSLLCNSFDQFLLNGTAMSCFVSNGQEAKFELCKANQCYVKTKNVDEDDVILTNERGCIDKLNGTMENVLTCDTALCNSFNDYSVVDLGMDTNICYKTFGDQTALVKCPSNHCEIGLQKVEGGKLKYTNHRDCALDDKLFDEENMTMACSTPRCNSLKEFTLSETFLGCVRKLDGNFRLQTCSDDDVGCFVKVSGDDRKQHFTDERGCTNKKHDRMAYFCESSFCNSFDQVPLNLRVSRCLDVDDEGYPVYKVCIRRS